MECKFNDIEYKRRGNVGKALKDLCFNIFKQYLELNSNLTYEDIKKVFNKMHNTSNLVVLSRRDWNTKTEDTKSRYCEPIKYNNEEYFFTTQWGNNGGINNNINNMILFAKEQNYNIFSGILNKKDKNKKLSYIKTKNIMLYGAPGVGKTYNYKKLISLIEGRDFKETDIYDFIINNKGDRIKKGSVDSFFKTVSDENRVEFLCFHQSYSYEDFIEGFRPNEDGNIKLESGIFKNISKKANDNLIESKKEISEIKSEKTFNEIFELYKDKIQEEIDLNQKFLINDTAYITNIENDSFRYTGKNWGNSNRMKFSDIVKMNELNLIERKDIKKAEGLSGLCNQHATYFSYFMQKFNNFKKNQNINVSDLKKTEQKNFYLVIDEINRGNISKIFGELITLIEEDKRDNYEVTLPYSKEKFKIPSNLYIIATMNSTDKSIATIDIALRRRFVFLKMKPQEGLVKNTAAKKLMNALNTFIYDKLNEDYQLGHSYFMKIENKEDLEFVKEYKIKPLLEEYFYADEDNYGKAENILNEK